ncbi:MAG: tRNA 4-thiouridine(8) synthase ThiI [Clostridia bacterium]|nr:tRNA 4-thiouridine(8) synthase ThiI [Clostridia bacterium]
MKEVLLCKYGELILKGANKSVFEDALCKELRIRSKHFGHFTVDRAQSTIYVTPVGDDYDMDGMLEAAGRVFGISALCRAAACEKNMEAIRQTIRDYLPPFMKSRRTFKVEAKRSDKTFPLDSMEIAAQAGGMVLETCPWLTVDVHTPDVVVKIEIRENEAYVHAGQFPGAGGMPFGSAGTGLLLLSGGIDSPVAGYMMAKRGLRLEAVHFESFPYTSELALDKVMRLAGLMARYTGPINMHIVSLTQIQEKIQALCDEEYFTLLLRRYMMAIADRIAEQTGSGALITGESLGQVASQTLQAIGVTNPLATRPVFRPCIGMDKEEIIRIARKIDTFDTSIEPFEDCCTVFTPRHPKTKPELQKVLAQEQKLDFLNDVEKAVDTRKTKYILAHY